MLVTNAVLSALLNLLLLVGLPFLVYFAYQKGLRKRGFGEIAQRAGLQLGTARYIGYSVVAAVVTAAVLLMWPPPIGPFLRDGSPQKPFVGLGLSEQAVVMALLYSVIKTGFAEEFFFRGLIAGSLGRRLSIGWANLLQAVIFLTPHLFILRVAPELWLILPMVFAGALFKGWVRMKSGSILGPWLIHASANVTICLSVANHTGS